MHSPLRCAVATDATRTIACERHPSQRWRSAGTVPPGDVDSLFPHGPSRRRGHSRPVYSRARHHLRSRSRTRSRSGERYRSRSTGASSVGMGTAMRLAGPHRMRTRVRTPLPETIHNGDAPSMAITDKTFTPGEKRLLSHFTPVLTRTDVMIDAAHLNQRAIGKAASGACYKGGVRFCLARDPSLSAPRPGGHLSPCAHPKGQGAPEVFFINVDSDSACVSH